MQQLDHTTGEIVSTNTGPLTAALAKAQMAFPPITRSKTVRVTTKTGGAYTFSYAPLDTILEAVRKPLADNGLAIAQLFDRDELVTLLLHESGASLVGRVTVPSANDVQGFGSAVTYLRRYAIQALLGIAAEEDDDGNSAAGNAATPAQKAPRATETAPAARKASEAAQDTPKPGQVDLDEDDWQGLFDEKPAPNGHTEGLSARDLFARLEKAGVDKTVAGDAARKMFGKWKLTDLTDEQRAAVGEEVGVA